MFWKAARRASSALRAVVPLRWRWTSSPPVVLYRALARNVPSGYFLADGNFPHDPDLVL